MKDRQEYPRLHLKKTSTGPNGKHYCGKRMRKENDEKVCDCCDGNCGPSNGCNCLACMEQDIWSRDLPRSSLVNRDGRVATRSPETGKFYCNRSSIYDRSSCNKEDNCYACSVLDKMTKPGGYYSSLL